MTLLGVRGITVSVKYIYRLMCAACVPIYCIFPPALMDHYSIMLKEAASSMFITSRFLLKIRFRKDIAYAVGAFLAKSKAGIIVNQVNRFILKYYVPRNLLG